MMRLLLALILCATTAFAQGGGSGSGAGTSRAARNASDSTPPTLSNILVTNITSSGATITWDSDEASSSRVCYSTTPGGPYSACSTLDATLVTSHLVTLSGLSASQAYVFVVKSSDAATNERVCNSDVTGCPSGTELTFTTAASGGITGEPTCGLESTSIIVPSSLWSTTQNRPTTDPTITSISRTGNVVTATLSSSAGLVVGGYLTVQGVSDSSFNIVNQTGITGSASGTTATVTTSAAHNLATGDVVNIEGASNDRWNGAWTVASTPTSTTFTFTHAISGVASMTSGTLSRAVKITGISGNDVTWAQTASNASSSGGTVATRKWLKPVILGTYTDLEFGCAVKKVGQTSLAVNGTGQNNIFYSTGNWLDTNNSKLLTRGTGGWHGWDTTAGTSRFLNIGGSVATPGWSLNNSDIIYFISGTKVRKYTWSTQATADVKDFGTSPNNCTVLEMGGSGGNSEGYAVAAATTGNDILPLICTKSGPTIFVLAYDVVADSILTTIQMPSTITTSGHLDHPKIFPAKGGNNKVFIRFGSGSPNSGNGPLGSGQISSITCSSQVFTVNTVIDFPNGVRVGEKVRIMRASPAGFNGLWTVASVPTTKQFTINSGAACPAASASFGTATAIGSQYTGMTVWNSDGTFNNNIEPIGAHNDIGLAPDSNELVVAMHKNSSNGPATFQSCNNVANVGVVLIKADAANWTAGSTCNDEAQAFLLYLGASIFASGAGKGNFNVNISIQGGWALVQMLGVQSPDSSQSATWDNTSTAWGKWFNEGVMAQVSLSANRKVKRVFRIFTGCTTYNCEPKLWLRRDGKKAYGNFDFRDNSGAAVADQVEVTLIDP